jgi:hypothetical protein
MNRDELLVFLNEWLDAYPYEVFPPANLREVAEGPDRTFTKAEAVSLAERNAAEMARHVLKVVRRKLKPDLAG